MICLECCIDVLPGRERCTTKQPPPPISSDKAGPPPKPSLSLSLFSILPPDYTHARSSSSSSDPFVVGPRGGGEEQTELLMDAPAAPPWRDTINLLAQISLFVYVGSVLFLRQRHANPAPRVIKAEKRGSIFPPFPLSSLPSSSYVSWFHTHVLESVHTESAKKKTHGRTCVHLRFLTLSKGGEGAYRRRDLLTEQKKVNRTPPSLLLPAKQELEEGRRKGIYCSLASLYTVLCVFSRERRRRRRAL